MSQPLAIEPSTANHWVGGLNLEFTHTQAGTQLSHSRVQAPLKVQRPFYPEGTHVCHTVMLHTAGGIVGGDRLATQIQLYPNAHALLTTAAATKIYRNSGTEAVQNVHIRLAEGACLEWFPQETIAFNGAHYRQTIHVDLAPDAVWLGWEMTRLGRTARGEQFLQGSWRSQTEVWQNGRLLWIDPQWLQGGSNLITNPHGLGGFSVVGSFAIVGRSLPADVPDKIRWFWQEGNRSGEAGVTRLVSGILCRYRGHSTVEARHWFLQVWQLIRPMLLDRPACIPRVWQL